MNIHNLPSPDNLIEWIHYIEEGRDKRIPGLIMELCFSQHLLGHLSEAIAIEKPVFGWFYVCVDHLKDVRHWFRIWTDEKPVLSKTELEMQNILSQDGHKFFALQAHLSTAQFKDKKCPVLIIGVEEWSTGGTSFVSQSALAKRYAEDIQNNFKSINDEKMRWKFSKKNGFIFKDLFSQSKVSVLRELFITRCVMNIGLSNPVDIDAITIDKENRLTFIEFKRKDPADYKLIEKESEKQQANVLAKHGLSIDERTSLLHRNTKVGKYIFDEECEKRKLQWKKKKCFGVDISHYRNIKLCNLNNFRYIYIVWDHTNERKGRKKVDLVEDLRGILDGSLRPRKWPELWWQELTPESVGGLTSTDGSDSGSYTSGVRIQMTFDLDNFDPIYQPQSYNPVAQVVSDTNFIAEHYRPEACPECHSLTRIKPNGKRGCTNYAHCKWYEKV